MLCPRKLSHSHLPKRKPRMKSQLVLVLLQAALHQLLMLMRNCFLQFLSSLNLESFSSPQASVELSEAETEYAVNVVFQHNCTNTIPEELLENVTVIVDASEAEEFSEVATNPLGSLPYDSPGQTFVAFEKPEGVPAVGKFSNMRRF